MTQTPTTLAAVLAMALDALADRRSPFRTPCLATLGIDGAPTLRTVVLRDFEPASRNLLIHTDARSAKFAELTADPRAALHGYDAATRMQLRLAGRATLHRDDAIADAAWAASRKTSRMTYATAWAPGTALPAPPAAPEDALGGRAHFAALLLRFDSLDWLLLDPERHLRARFDWAEDGAMAASWVAP